jgi:hypothetical protein
MFSEKMWCEHSDRALFGERSSLILILAVSIRLKKESWPILLRSCKLISS